MWIVENVNGDLDSNGQAPNIPHTKCTPPHTQLYLSFQRSEPPSSLRLDALICQTPWVNNAIHGWFFNIRSSFRHKTLNQGKLIMPFLISWMNLIFYHITCVLHISSIKWDGSYIWCVYFFSSNCKRFHSSNCQMLLLRNSLPFSNISYPSIKAWNPMLWAFKNILGRYIIQKMIMLLYPTLAS